MLASRSVALIRLLLVLGVFAFAASARAQTPTPTARVPEGKDLNDRTPTR